MIKLSTTKITMPFQVIDKEIRSMATVDSLSQILWPWQWPTLNIWQESIADKLAATIWVQATHDSETKCYIYLCV